jgi:hypothetical protein
LDDFVGEFAILAWIASQCAHFELAAGLQGTYYSASLLSCGANYCDELFIVGYHVDPLFSERFREVH